MTRCEQCDLPMVECSGLAVARRELEAYLRLNGYTGLQARVRSAELIPEVKRRTYICGGTDCGAKSGELHGAKCLLAGQTMN